MNLSNDGWRSGIDFQIMPSMGPVYSSRMWTLVRPSGAYALVWCTDSMGARCTHMEIGVRQFRSEMRRWLEKVKAGEEVVITERGLPVARVSGVDSAPVLERLVAEGVIRRPKRPARSIDERELIRARGTVSDLVPEQRR